MSAERPGCPPREVLESYVLCSGPHPGLDPESDPDLLEHLESCDRCRLLAEDLRAENALLSEAAALARPGQGLHRDRGPGRAPGTPGATPDGFEVFGEIHRGGQGVVYDAIQTSTRRRIALKTLLRGAFATSDERRRFEREVEIVASLRHPGIVTLYESGVSADGAGWFAMEYVEGLTFDQHLMATRPSRRERVRLVQAIAEALSCAHQHGVIHRDLKPGNVLVTSTGEPRILDFGLARPLDRDRAMEVTVDGRFVGTLAYAAPEQLAGDAAVDVRSDIYAIGLMLYEALAGARPVEGAVSLEAFLRARREQVPIGRLRHAGVDADLRAIVAKATAPEPQRRYQSSAALAEDLRRWLDGRPVAARADSPGYLLMRAARRHWLAFGSAAAVVLLVSVLAVVLSVLLVRVERQRAIAERTLETFTTALLAADPLAADPAGSTLSEFLEGAGRRIERSLAEDPEVAVRVRSTLGGIAFNLADLDRAERDFAYVLQASRAIHGPRSLETARALHDLARAKYRRGDFAAAANLYEESLAIRRRLLGRVDADVATTIGHLAACRRRLGEITESEALYRESLAIREALAEQMPEALAESLNNLAIFLMDVGRLDEAALLLERSLEMISGLAGPSDWRTARAMSNLASAALDRGEVSRARILLEDSRGIWLERVTPDHPHVATLTLLLGRCALVEGDPVEGGLLCGEALAARSRRGSERHPDVLEARLWWAVALREMGEAAKSERHLRQVIAERSPNTVSGPLMRAEIELATTLARLGRMDEAEEILRERADRFAEGSNPFLERLAMTRLDQVRQSR